MKEKSQGKIGNQPLSWKDGPHEIEGVSHNIVVGDHKNSINSSTHLLLSLSIWFFVDLPECLFWRHPLTFWQRIG